MALMLAPLAAPAQEEGGGLGALLEDGARGVIEGLIEDMQPAIDDLEGMLAEYGPLLRMLGKEMGPALLDVFREVDSVANYAPPEILPNGDIIMRRRPDAPDWVPPAPDAPPEDPGTAAPPGPIDL